MTRFATEPCRSCTAPVIWCDDEKGRPKPVDAEPAVGGTIAIDAPTAGRKPRARTVRPELTFGRRDLHRYHIDTCPQADQWRRATARKRSYPS